MVWLSNFYSHYFWDNQLLVWLVTSIKMVRNQFMGTMGFGKKLNIINAINYNLILDFIFYELSQKKFYFYFYFYESSRRRQIYWMESLANRPCYMAELLLKCQVDPFFLLVWQDRPSTKSTFKTLNVFWMW